MLADFQICISEPLKIMSRDPRLYGSYVTSAGEFEPIITLDDIVPANLLWFLFNCSGDCTTKRYSCKKSNIKCISACGGCHGILCKNNEVEAPLPESDYIKRFQIILADSVNYAYS